MISLRSLEVNEAFAQIHLAWAKEFKADMAKLNVNGGAMVPGKPCLQSMDRKKQHSLSPPKIHPDLPSLG